jgi:hypothetical protein
MWRDRIKRECETVLEPSSTLLAMNFRPGVQVLYQTSRRKSQGGREAKLGKGFQFGCVLYRMLCSVLVLPCRSMSFCTAFAILDTDPRTKLEWGLLSPILPGKSSGTLPEEVEKFCGKNRSIFIVLQFLVEKDFFSQLAWKIEYFKHSEVCLYATAKHTVWGCHLHNLWLRRDQSKNNGMAFWQILKRSFFSIYRQIV